MYHSIRLAASNLRLEDRVQRQNGFPEIPAEAKRFAFLMVLENRDLHAGHVPRPAKARTIVAGTPFHDVAPGIRDDLAIHSVTPAPDKRSCKAVHAIHSFPLNRPNQWDAIHLN